MRLALPLACLAHIAVVVFAQPAANGGGGRVLFPDDSAEERPPLPSVPQSPQRPVQLNVSSSSQSTTLPSSTPTPSPPPPSQAQRCSTTDVQSGKCVAYDQCPAFMGSTPDFEALRRNLCGFSGQIPRVCCQIRESRTLDTPEMVSRMSMPNVSQPVTPQATNRPQLLPADCGQTKTSYLRIVNGEEAEPGAWPWLAALYIEEKGVKSAECGAALISSTYVITAAHCVTGNGGNLISPRQLFVRLGDHNLFSTDDGARPVDIAVASVTRHAEFQIRTFLNDIALLRLREPAELNDFVFPICLPFDPPIRTDDLQDKAGFVAGWGTTSFDGPSSPVVRQVRLPIWNATACRHAYRNDVNITSAYLCAGYADGGKDACQGDSGGPLMLPVNPEGRFHLVGIVSFGKKCAEVGFPGVYTNLRQYLPWIAQNIR